MIVFVKTCFCWIQLTRHAEFVEKLLKTAEVKKTYVSFSLWRATNGWKET